MNELEIKRLLEEDLKEIDQKEIEERRRNQEGSQNSNREFLMNNNLENLRKRAEELRKKLDEDRKKYEEEMKRYRDQLERNIEERNRRIEEILYNYQSANRRGNQYNYNNLIESKIDVNKLNEENKKCVICYEDFMNNDSAIFLPCFHVFHSNCIREWLSKKDICPLCKINIKNNLNQ